MSKLSKILLTLCGTSAVTLSLSTFGAADASSSDNVVINELCAKNTTYTAPDGKYYDWIELYNPTASAINLSGYGLSDDSAKPYRYTFPEGTVIESGKYLLVFCNSGGLSIDGQHCADFGLSTDGEIITLTDKSGNNVDTLEFGAMESNVSYGRVPDGSEIFAFMELSPGTENTASGIIDVDVSKPVFSQDGGFYDNSFNLSLTAKNGLTIRYTLDGSDPDSSSTVYSSPINISDISNTPNILSARTDISPSTPDSPVTAPRNPVDKAVVIKAAAFDANGNSSEVVTNTYFVGYGNKASYYKDYKIISIVTESDNLFDYEKGIYVLGKTYDDWRYGPDFNPATETWEMPGNFTQKGAEWERPASMEIFENGISAVSQNVGIRIHGGASRTATQKSLNIYARSEYGASKVNYDLFNGSAVTNYDGSQINEFDSFMIRNGGNDAQYARFRDKLNQFLVRDRAFLTQAMEPCIVFINGEFWGQYEITEKLSDDFISDHYDVKKKNICIIKNEGLDTGEQAGVDDYYSLKNWLNSNDMSNEANYTQLCERIDMQGYIDYVSAEIYFNNWDWGYNNIAAWRSMVTDDSSPYSDGKWRFVMFDTEYSANLYGLTGADTNSFTQLTKSRCMVSDILRASLKNDGFRKQFALTFMDMANYNFDTDRINSLLNELTPEYKDMTIDTFNRFWPNWPGGIHAESQYSTETTAIRSFYNSRFSSITADLKSTLSLKGNLVNLTLKNDDSCGSVKLNTISPEMENGSWSGKYYTDYAVTLTASPKAGYRFMYWETSDGRKFNSAEAEIALSADVTVTAVYVESAAIAGDIDLDGDVDADDAVLLRSFLAAAEKLSAEQGVNADINSDGYVDSFDLALLRSLL